MGEGVRLFPSGVGLVPELKVPQLEVVVEVEMEVQIAIHPSQSQPQVNPHRRT